MSQNIQQIIADLSNTLRGGGIDNPRLEARILVGATLGIPAVEVLFSHQNLTTQQEEKLLNWVQLRLAHQPIDKIIGVKEFYKSSFKVSCDVLSPRPDTEILVEEAIGLARENHFEKILDLGTGSGCIILSILGDIPKLKGKAIDQSVAALEIARENALHLGLENQVEFIHASWFDEDVATKTGVGFDVIVSNPPYIPSDDIATLDAEVKVFDPFQALDGGSSGLMHYEKISQLSPSLLKPKGYILLEIGISQASEVIKIFQSQGFSHVQTLLDLGGIERCLVMQLS